MTAKPRAFYGPIVLAEEVGLARWQFERAQEAGMLPPRGRPNGWLPDQVDAVRELVPAIVERFGKEHPIGAARSAERIGTRLGLDVEPADVAALADAGHLAVVDVFEKRRREYDLYAPAQLDALTADVVRPVVDDRQAWERRSVPLDEAAERLGWSRQELRTVMRTREIEPRLWRIAGTDVDALAADEALHADLRADRLVNADGAAALLGVARRHFDICVEAGWIEPKSHVTVRLQRRRTVQVPQYRTGDVEALLARPDVDWAAVRETPKGKRSPLRDLLAGRSSSQ